MIIRKFNPKEVKELSELMRETIVVSNSADYSKKAIKLLYEEYSAEKLLEDAKRMDVFVAEEKSELIGTVSLVGNRVSRMFVKPKYHGKKIGSLLLKHLEQFAKQKGIKVLRVRSSVTAYGFYQKLGFLKPRKTMDKYIGQVIWMKKEVLQFYFK